MEIMDNNSSGKKCYIRLLLSEQNMTLTFILFFCLFNLKPNQIRLVLDT